MGISPDNCACVLEMPALKMTAKDKRSIALIVF